VGGKSAWFPEALIVLITNGVHERVLIGDEFPDLDTVADELGRRLPKTLASEILTQSLREEPVTVICRYLAAMSGRS